MDLQDTPVAREAKRLGLPVLTPKSLRTEEAQAAFAAHGADAAVVVAYGLILPQPILDAVPLGCFNLHASLLPRWRGAAPINRAIMAGDAESGVTVMKMDEGLDTGGMAMMERVAIGPDMTAGELHDRLAAIGGDLMHRALGALERGSLQIVPQPLHGGIWHSYEDHRMATTGALIGLGVEGVQVDDIATTSKTLPEFPQLWLGALLGHGTEPSDPITLL